MNIYKGRLISITIKITFYFSWYVFYNGLLKVKNHISEKITGRYCNIQLFWTLHGETILQSEFERSVTIPCKSENQLRHDSYH